MLCDQSLPCVLKILTNLIWLWWFGIRLKPISTELPQNLLLTLKGVKWGPKITMSLFSPRFSLEYTQYKDWKKYLRQKVWRHYAMTTIVPGQFSQLPCREVDRGLKRGPPRPFRHPRSPEEWIRRKSELEKRNWISFANYLTHTTITLAISLSVMSHTHTPSTNYSWTGDIGDKTR